MSLDKDFVTYFKIRSGEMLHISEFLVMLLGYRDFSFEGTIAKLWAQEEAISCLG